MNTRKPNPQIEELLRMQGVMAKGYGCVAKSVLFAPELTITTKGLYAYLCSLTGGGTVTWPRRENILRALRLSKTTYYKALNLLIASGYITVEHQRVSGRWDRNIYTIVNKPAQFDAPPSTEERGQLRYSGMFGNGFGMIPRLAMQDERMGIKPKALYAYLLCYANTGSCAFPQVSTVLNHLNIGVDSFQKYMRTLVALGYIVRKQRRVEGRFSVYDYYLCEQPMVGVSGVKKWDVMDEAMIPPQPEICDAINAAMVTPESEICDTVNEDTAASQPEFCDTDNYDVAPPEGEFYDTADADFPPVLDAPQPENWDAEKSYPDSLDDRLNTSKIKYQIKSIPRGEEDPHHQADGKTEIEFAMLQGRSIPRRFLGNEQNMTAALRAACDFYDEFPLSDDPAEQDRYETVFQALRNLCCHSKSKVRGKYVTPGEVLDLLNSRCVDVYPDKVDLTLTFDYLAEAYEAALEDRTIQHEPPLKNPVAYARYVVWDALQIYQRPSEFAF